MFIDKLHKIDSKALAKINPDAAQILSNVIAAYKTILSKRQDMDKRGLSAQPLHIIIGEEHRRPSHKIFQDLLVKAVSEIDPNAPLSLGLENDRNIGGCNSNLFKVKTVLRRFFNGAETRHISDKTPQMLQDYLKHHFTNDAYYSTRKFIVGLYEQSDKIVTEFNDASFRPRDGYVNISDSYVAHCVNQALIQADSNIAPTDESGMLIRNLCMSSRMNEMATENGSRLTVQICGQGHVNGLKDTWDHKNSISALHKANNQEILAIFAGDDAAYPIDLSPQDYFICQALSQYTAFYEPAAMLGEWPSQNEKDEIAFVDAIYKALNL